MKVTCPKCGGAIPAADINMQAGVLLCRACDEMFPLPADGGDIPLPVPDDFRIDEPPAGAWYEAGIDGEVVGATCRGAGGAIFALVFAAMFMGIPVAVYLDWLLSGKPFEAGNLFLLLFLAVGLGAAIVLLVKLVGVTSITLSAHGFRLYTGVFGIGWRKTMDVESVTAIRQEQCGNSNGRPFYHLVFIPSSGKNVACGMFLSQQRLDYIEHALQAVLRKRPEITFRKRLRRPDMDGDSGD